MDNYLPPSRLLTNKLTHASKKCKTIQNTYISLRSKLSQADMREAKSLELSRAPGMVPSGRAVSPRPGRLLPRLGKGGAGPGPGARSSPSLRAAGPHPSLPDRLPPPLEQVAAVGHQTEHPRSLLPPPPIRASGGDGPRAPRPGSGAPRPQAPLRWTGQRAGREGGDRDGSLGPAPNRVRPPPRDSPNLGSGTPERR